MFKYFKKKLKTKLRFVKSLKDFFCKKFKSLFQNIIRLNLKSLVRYTQKKSTKTGLPSSITGSKNKDCDIAEIVADIATKVKTEVVDDVKKSLSFTKFWVLVGLNFVKLLIISFKILVYPITTLVLIGSFCVVYVTLSPEKNFNQILNLSLGVYNFINKQNAITLSPIVITKDKQTLGIVYFEIKKLSIGSDINIKDIKITFNFFLHYLVIYHTIHRIYSRYTLWYTGRINIYTCG
jgi:hypothetical protein